MSSALTLAGSRNVGLPYDGAVAIDDRDLALAREHPRGTERRTLLRYRAALSDVDAYARLPSADRDVIVRWAEVRRRLRAEGLDHDPANLADPLLPYAALRERVVAGELAAAGTAADAAADDGDLRGVVARIRAASPR